MDKFYRLQGKLSLLLIPAILILSAGFFIVSCGDPQVKTKNTNRGPFAVDFTTCPDTHCYSLAEGSGPNPAPDVSQPLTVEAWVKNKGTSGGIFSRIDPSRGILLYLKDDEPKFGMKVQTAPSSTQGSPTPTAEYTVGSGLTLLLDAWTHITGVIANAVHSHTTSASCTTTVMAETPHLDIYVNGEFQNCATTWGGTQVNGDPDPATGPQFPTNPGHQQVVVGNILRTDFDGVPLAEGNIEAVIDEVRFWLVEKTESDIQQCMNTELGFQGPCNRGNQNLWMYHRYNEGEGATGADWSGRTLTGFLFTLDAFGEHEWEDGWAEGNLSLQRTD